MMPMIVAGAGSALDGTAGHQQSDEQHDDRRDAGNLHARAQDAARDIPSREGRDQVAFGEPMKRSITQLNTPDISEPMNSDITMTPGISERS